MMWCRLRLLSALLIVCCCCCCCAGFPLSDLLGHKGYITPRPVNYRANESYRTTRVRLHSEVIDLQTDINNDPPRFPAKNSEPLQTKLSAGKTDFGVLQEKPHNEQSLHFDRIIPDEQRNLNKASLSVVNFLVASEKHQFPSVKQSVNNVRYIQVHTINKRDAGDDDEDDDDADDDDDHHSDRHLLDHILDQIKSGHVTHDRITHWMHQIEHAVTSGSISQDEVNHFIDQLRGTPVGRYLGDKCCLFG